MLNAFIATGHKIQAIEIGEHLKELKKKAVLAIASVFKKRSIEKKITA